MTMKPALCIIASLLMLGQGGPRRSWADSGKQQARVLFKEGNVLYKRGMFFDALKKFKQARALYPSAKIDLNIGSTLDALGQRAKAAAYLERVLLQKGSATVAMEQQVRRFLAALEQKVASVRLSCPEEGATVTLDGAVVGATPLAVRIFMEPGRHRLEVDKSSVGVFARQLNLIAGQHITVDAPLAQRPAAATGPGARDPRVAVAPAPPPTAAARRTRSIVAYTTLGVGAALAVGAAVMYGVGTSQGDEAHEAYDASQTQAEFDAHYEDVEAAKAKLVVGHVLVGLAAAALGASVYAFVTRPEPEQQAPAGPRAALGVTPDGCAVLTFGGQF